MRGGEGSAMKTLSRLGSAYPRPQAYAAMHALLAARRKKRKGAEVPKSV